MTRLTVAQALVRFLAAQERRARRRARSRFFAGCLGHLRPRQRRRASARRCSSTPTCCPTSRRATSRRWSTSPPATRASATGSATFACTTSVGPGATNMVTGAALATINRLPVLLLPGDTFATRAPHPVLQQLEAPARRRPCRSTTASARCRATSTASSGPSSSSRRALEAMRVLTDPAETGAVTLALPEDVQTEAFEVPGRVPRAARVDDLPPAAGARGAGARAATLIRAARAAADRRRRRRDLQRGDGRAARVRRRDRHPGGRDAGRAAARCSPTTRCRSARSAPPAPRPPTGSRARPTS